MTGKLKIWMVGLALIALAGLAVAAGPGYGLGRECQLPGWDGTVKPEPWNKRQN